MVSNKSDQLLFGSGFFVELELSAERHTQDGEFRKDLEMDTIGLCLLTIYYYIYSI